MDLLTYYKILKEIMKRFICCIIFSYFISANIFPVYSGNLEKAKSIELNSDSLQWKSILNKHIKNSLCQYPHKSLLQPIEIFPKGRQIEIYNTTEYEIESLIRWVGQYLALEGIKINVYSLPSKFMYIGVLTKIEGAYNLYLKKNLKNYKLVVTHEMIHVKQFESEKLEIINESIVHFKGQSIDLRWVDYKSRPYEIEAHMDDKRILKKFNKSNLAHSGKKDKVNGHTYKNGCKEAY